MKSNSLVNKVNTNQNLYKNERNLTTPVLIHNKSKQIARNISSPNIAIDKDLVPSTRK